MSYYVADRAFGIAYKRTTYVNAIMSHSSHTQSRSCLNPLTTPLAFQFLKLGFLHAIHIQISSRPVRLKCFQSVNYFQTCFYLVDEIFVNKKPIYASLDYSSTENASSIIGGPIDLTVQEYY